MNKAIKLTAVIAITLVLVLVVLTVVISRKVYGVWNPYDTPKRVECYGRTYNLSGSPNKVEIIGDTKPMYKISQSFLDKLSGKELFMTHPKGEFVPTVIFLHIEGDEYFSLALSGGP